MPLANTRKPTKTITGRGAAPLRPMSARSMVLANVAAADRRGRLTSAPPRCSLVSRKSTAYAVAQGRPPGPEAFRKSDGASNDVQARAIARVGAQHRCAPSRQNQSCEQMQRPRTVAGASRHHPRHVTNSPWSSPAVLARRCRVHRPFRSAPHLQVK